MNRPLCLAVAMLACLVFRVTQAAPFPVADFEDLTFARGNFYNGADGAGGFTSHGAHFQNNFTDFGGFSAWEGWSYSRLTDVNTAGFGNQYSAYHLPSGGGSGGSSNYAIASKFDFDPADPELVTGRVTLPTGFVPKSVDLTNATYTALSMLHGDAFSKKFGGPGGSDADWLRLTILGLDAQDHIVGSVPFYLADYRNLGGAPDYVVSQWTTVDLRSLGAPTALQFVLESTDNGTFGMNTPAYFALDNLTPVPEPSALALALLGLALLAGRRMLSRAAR